MLLEKATSRIICIIIPDNKIYFNSNLNTSLQSKMCFPSCSFSRDVWLSPRITMTPENCFHIQLLREECFSVLHLNPLFFLSSSYSLYWPISHSETSLSLILWQPVPRCRCFGSEFSSSWRLSHFLCLTLCLALCEYCFVFASVQYFQVTGPNRREFGSDLLWIFSFSTIFALWEVLYICSTFSLRT